MADRGFFRLACLVSIAAAGPVIVLGAKTARAQDVSTTASGRAAILQDAQVARQRGDHARALELAQRAGAMQMTPSLRLFIAEEQGALGHVAEAYQNAGLCVDSAEQDLTLRNRDAILERCHALLVDLRPQVAEVRVRVSETAATEVRVLLPRAALPAPPQVPVVAPTDAAINPTSPTNGATVTPTAPMVPASAEPATSSDADRNRGHELRDVVVVEATAPGRLPTHQDMTVASGESVSLDVVLQSDPSATAQPSRRDAASTSNGIPAGAVAITAAGVVGLGASVAFYVMRNQAIGNCVSSGADLVCPTQDDADRAQSAGAWTALADASLVAGGALVVGGALWLLFGRHGTEQPRAMLSAAPLQGGMMLGVGGSL